MKASSMHMIAHGSQIFEAWHLSEFAVVTAALGISGLLVAWARLSRRQQSLLCLSLAISVLLLSSGIQALSMSNYSAHMTEHLVVIFVIAPLLAGAVSLPLRRSLATIGFLALTVLIPLFHLTPMGSWVMNYPEGHLVELIAFLAVGVWFWTPVYGTRRVMGDQQRITYTLLALPVIATTGLVLWSATPTSLHDVGMNMSNVTILNVHAGGLVMMEFGTAAMVAHVVALALAAVAHRRATREPVGLRYA